MSKPSEETIESEEQNCRQILGLYQHMGIIPVSLEWLASVTPEKFFMIREVARELLRARHSAFQKDFDHLYPKPDRTDER